MRSFLTRRQAAEYLGVSVRTIDEWKAAGKIAYYKVGGSSIRFSVADLDRQAVHRPSADEDEPVKRGLFSRLRGGR